MLLTENQNQILFTNRAGEAKKLICRSVEETWSWYAMSMFASGLQGENRWHKLIPTRSQTHNEVLNASLTTRRADYELNALFFL